MYLWDLDDDPSAGGKEFAFAGAVVLKKGPSCPMCDQRVLALTSVLAPQEAQEGQASIPSGSWDSLHVFECAERGRSAKYKLTSTVMLVLNTGTIARAEIKGLGEDELKGKGDVTLSGSMTRQVRSGSRLQLARS